GVVAISACEQTTWRRSSAWLEQRLHKMSGMLKTLDFPGFFHFPLHHLPLSAPLRGCRAGLVCTPAESFTPPRPCRPRSPAPVSAEERQRVADQGRAYHAENDAERLILDLRPECILAVDDVRGALHAVRHVNQQAGEVFELELALAALELLQDL